MTQLKKGSLKVVGTGINVVNQTTLSARSYIENADIVFIAVHGAMSHQWIHSLNDNVVSLSQFYQEGKSRVQTYQDMVDTMSNAVREGKNVVAAYYGHPGVFVTPTHQVIAMLREEGFEASMDPGISAEDCLYADLGIDPGKTGCQAMESTQFLFYDHKINPHNLLILWQVCLSGEHTLRSLAEDQCSHGLRVLSESLQQYYPPQHEVILYEAATMAMTQAKIERLPLSQLPQSKPSLISTLVIPAIGLPDFDHQTLAKLGLTAQDVIASSKGNSAG